MRVGGKQGEGGWDIAGVKVANQERAEVKEGGERRG